MICCQRLGKKVNDSQVDEVRLRHTGLPACASPLMKGLKGRIALLSRTKKKHSHIFRLLDHALTLD